MFNAPRQSARLIGLALLLFTALSPSASPADEQDAATRLFTEAVAQATQAAPPTSFDEQLELIGQLEAILTEIVELYPDSHIGKALAEGQSLGGLSFAELREARAVVLNHKIAYETTLAQRVDADRREQEKIDAQIVRDPCFSAPDAACLLAKLEASITSIQDPRSRGDAFVQAAALQLKLGNHAQADTNVQIALNVTSSLPDNDSWGVPSARHHIGRLATEAGNTELALRVADTLKRDKQDHVRWLAVKALADAGRYDEAVQTLTGISDPIRRVRGSLHLAKRYRVDEKGDSFFKELSRTRQYISQIPDQTGTVGATIELLEVLIEAGLPEDAKRLLDEVVPAVGSIASPEDRSRLYRRLSEHADKVIGRALARDLLQRSFDAIQDVQDSKQRMELTSHLAYASAHLGETEIAHDVFRFGLNELSDIEDLEARLSAAAYLVIPGDTNDTAPFDEELSQVLQKEFEAITLTSDAELAWDWMAEISTIQYRVGATETARANLAHLIHETEQIEDPGDRLRRMKRITFYQDVFGDYDGLLVSLEITRGLAFREADVFLGRRNSLQEDFVREDVAVAYASQGHHDKAVQEVLKIEDDEQRPEVHINVARRQARIGAIGESIRTMLRVEDETLRVPALIAMIVNLAPGSDNSTDLDDVLWEYKR